MSKEIKFRAWDEQTGKMLLNVGTHPHIAEIHDDGSYTIPTVPGRWILMQFTGLTDRNGKEIYEGDILRTDFSKTNNHDAYSEIGEVAFEALRWTVTNKRYGSYHRFYGHSKIIGNIYENPELLKTV